MLTIRLQRTGKKNQSDFRIVLAEKESHVSKKIVEILGSYNPRKKNFQVKEDRVKYWITQRIDMSPTAHNLFVSKGLLDQKKVKAFNTPKTDKSEKSDESEIKSETPENKTAEDIAQTPSETPTVETPAEAKEAEVVVEEKIVEAEKSDISEKSE